MAWIEPALKVLGAATFVWRRLGWLRRFFCPRPLSSRRRARRPFNESRRRFDFRVRVEFGTFRRSSALRAGKKQGKVLGVAYQGLKSLAKSVRPPGGKELGLGPRE